MFYESRPCVIAPVIMMIVVVVMIAIMIAMNKGRQEETFESVRYVLVENVVMVLWMCTYL